MNKEQNITELEINFRKNIFNYFLKFNCAIYRAFNYHDNLIKTKELKNQAFELTRNLIITNWDDLFSKRNEEHESYYTLSII